MIQYKQKHVLLTHISLKCFNRVESLLLCLHWIFKVPEIARASNILPVYAK